MNKQHLHNTMALALLFGAFSTGANSAASGQKATFYEPPTVSIPAGSFYMGSDQGRDDEKPVHKVSVPAFQMGKYEVTLAEFRKYAEATGYVANANCNHRIGPKWFGTGPKDGSWDDNIYASNEFFPVVCVTRSDAINYANWLSAQTGKHYRLPTEAEWEYTLRAGTDTRYFYGDEDLSSLACQYANLSDTHAKTHSEKRYNAPYSEGYKVHPCSDSETLLSVVGIYQPNPFGVYDMLGNVVERLSDCYQDSYGDAPTDGSAVFKTHCDAYVARGGSWHWEAFPSAKRMKMPDSFLAALEGFRLVLDTNGKTMPSQTGSSDFVKRLKKAQKSAKQAHSQID